MSQLSFTAMIIRDLTKIAETILNKSPDAKHNTGRMLSEASLWDEVEKYAKKQSEIAWKKLEDEEIIDSEGLTEGDHILAESPNFAVTLKVSAPRRQFSPDILAESLKKYKVPVPIAKELINKAKVDGNPTRTFKVVER